MIFSGFVQVGKSLLSNLMETNIISVIICINPFPHNDTFSRPSETSLLKTLWEKEKLLVTSNFSFTHSVFYPVKELALLFSSNSKLPSADCFNLDLSKILSSGNGLNELQHEKEVIRTFA